ELIRGPKTTNQQLQKELAQAQKTIRLLQKDEKGLDFSAIQQKEYQKILKINQATTLVAVAEIRNNLIQTKFGKNASELKK
ncbi:5774_t:CDS:2, partial [Cetraspora pellucida]